jgi:dTDP-4-dehydrorhamnose reductase
MIVNNQKLRVLVLGASGMLGNTLFRLFSESDKFNTIGTMRSTGVPGRLPVALHKNIVHSVDANDMDNLHRIFAHIRPDVVINCVGLVKQLMEEDDPLVAIPINALLPHRIARLCEVAGARLIHVSTDCVFSGSKGGYREDDHPDADDLYGRSKYLGEVDYAHSITLRTSIIGHELNSSHGLVNWFLGQQDQVKGYTNAIFSGLPTIELARLIRDLIIPNTGLRGVYHVSAEPISKFHLLQLIAKVYGKKITVIADDLLKIDRSLNSDRFRIAAGYVPPSWPDLIQQMSEFR